MKTAVINALPQITAKFENFYHLPHTEAPQIVLEKLEPKILGFYNADKRQVKIDPSHMQTVTIFDYPYTWLNYNLNPIETTLNA